MAYLIRKSELRLISQHVVNIFLNVNRVNGEVLQKLSYLQENDLLKDVDLEPFKKHLQQEDKRLYMQMKNLKKFVDRFI